MYRNTKNTSDQKTHMSDEDSSDYGVTNKLYNPNTTKDHQVDGHNMPSTQEKRPSPYGAQTKSFKLTEKLNPHKKNSSYNMSDGEDVLGKYKHQHAERSRLEEDNK